jgi:hypothetical protein
MTDVLHPLGLTTPADAPNPEWERVRQIRDALWLAQFVADPADIEADDDHDDIPEAGFRPSFVPFAIALALGLAALMAVILPAILN